jgi:hypothetical protein
VKQFRFFYDDSWTRWLGFDEVSLLRRVNNITKVQVMEDLSREQFNREFPEFEFTNWNL